MRRPAIQLLFSRRGPAAVRLAEVIEGLRPLLDAVPTVLPAAPWVLDDEADDWVVQCAITARADRIVSGDRHLLSLHDIRGILIMAPLAFLDELNS